MPFNNSTLKKLKPIIMTTPRIVKSIGGSPSRLALLLIPLVFACFALSPSTQAVVPAPDGGYPNFTTAEGDNALKALTTGVGNTAVGTFSLFSVSTGNFNTAVGAGSLDLNQADSNTATGAAALLLNTTGTENTAVGTAALEFNDTGRHNAATGAFALFVNTTGDNNTANGAHALFSDTTGRENTAIGADTLYYNTTGIDNVAIGNGAGFNVVTASNVICLGANVFGGNVNNSCYIGNIYGQPIDPASATQVGVDSTGKLGTTTSSRRFKHDIKPMDNASEAILALKPVTFCYKSDAKDTPCFGLIAEEVEKVNPALVVPDNDGKPFTVRYDAVNAMLLNEFLKEHRKVEQMQKQIDALTVGLQKVSAQLEVNKSAPQTVLNNQ